MLTLPRKNLLAGLFCVLLGAFVAVRGFGYSIGSLSNVGAGFFPFVLGTILVLCGIGIGVQALRRVDKTFEINLRPYLLIPAAIVAFALTIDRIGLIPAVALTALIASLADRHATLIGRICLATGLVGLVYIVFVVILRIPLDPVTWRF